MSKIELSDSTMDIIVKMSEENPGAVTAIAEIMAKAGVIDPQAFMGGVGTLLILDTWKIYGSSIYVLWNDKCGRDVRKLLMLLRATQLGLFSVKRLQSMAADHMCEENITADEMTELDGKVRSELKDFAKAA